MKILPYVDDNYIAIQKTRDKDQEIKYLSAEDKTRIGAITKLLRKLVPTFNDHLSLQEHNRDWKMVINNLHRYNEKTKKEIQERRK